MEKLRRIELFEHFGVMAGIVVRSNWGSQDEIYEFIKGGVFNENAKLIAPKQTHSAEIARLKNNIDTDKITADGAICESPGYCLTVRTADCIPLLFADHSALFGAVHVGWRGLAGGILDELFLEVREMGYFAEDINIYLGPSIGRCCFEVGDDVAALFESEFVEERGGRLFVDLPGAARNIIAGRGVKEANVVISEECTFCGGNNFYSYRREGAAPLQMVSYIYRP